MFSFFLLILLLGILMFCLVDNKISHNKIYFIIFMFVVILYSIVLGNRSVLLQDTMAYKQVYNNITWSEFSQINFWKKGRGIFYMEYGYLFLCFLFKSLGISFVMFQSIIIFFELIVILMSIGIINETEKIKDRNLYEELLLVICVYGLYYQGIAFRAGISYSFIFLGVAFLYRRKKIIPILCLLVSFSIHRISILAIIVYALCMINIKISLRYFWGVWVGIGIVLFSDMWTFSHDIIDIMKNNFTVLIERMVRGYLDNFRAVNSNLSLYSFLCWGMGGVLIKISEKIKRDDKLLNIYFVGLISLVLLIGYYGGRRIYDTFIIFGIPLLLSKNCYKDEKVRLGLCVLFSLFAGIINLRIYLL